MQCKNEKLDQSDLQLTSFNVIHAWYVGVNTRQNFNATKTFWTSI